MAFSCYMVVLLSLAVPLMMVQGAVSVSDAERPAGKVVKLLTAMAEQLEKEQDEDEDIYNAYACWCESNDKEKTKAIADAEQHSLDLEASIEELVGRTTALSLKVENLDKEIEATEQALAKADSVRQKDAAEFHQGETDSIEAIEGLKNAVHVLSGHHGDSASALLQVQKLIKGRFGEAALRKFGIAPAHRRALASFIQQPAGYAQSTNQAQSGEIYGVLKSMKESFENNYETSKSDEQGAKSEYGELTAAKRKGLNEAKAQHLDKAKAFAEAKDSLASDRTDLDDTKEQLEADQYFLKDLQERCAAMDDEWANRSKVRMLEQKAVSEAIGLLNSDDARDTFQKTQGAASLLQVAKADSTNVAAHIKASQLLAVAAKRLNKPKLAALAVSMKSAMKSDVFTKMKASMDKMVETLKLDQANEVKEKDFCVQSLHDNGFEMESRYRDKSDLDVKIADLTELKERLTKEIKEATEELSQTRIEMKRAAENRKNQNREFLQVVSDQRTEQDLLAQALKKLSNFYNKVSIREAEFVQKGSRVAQEPPAGFKPYKKAGGSGGVMGVIRDIISESEMEETESTKSEQVAQQTYEKLIADSNASVKALLAQIADMNEQLAQCNGDLTQANADMLALSGILDDLNQAKKDIEYKCNHVLKYFDERQQARIEEIDALLSAKAIMSTAA